MSKVIEKYSSHFTNFSPLFVVPSKYEIINITQNISELKEDTTSIIRVIPISHPLTLRTSKSIPYNIIAEITNKTHNNPPSRINLKFFAGNPSWWNKLFPIHKEVIISGKPKFYNNEISFIHPKKLENSNQYLSAQSKTIITPYYKKHNTKIEDYTIQEHLLNAIKAIPEITPKVLEKIIFHLGLEKQNNLHSAITEIHKPTSTQNLTDSKHFLSTLEYISYKNTLQKINQHNATPLTFTNSLSNVEANFSFALTQGQQNAIKEISKFQQSPNGKLFLLQGDVGCGKTIVAITVAINAVNSGFQVAILAPTQILAMQLYHNFNDILSKFQIECSLLTSKDSTKTKKEKLSNIKNGTTQIIIGTHAIFAKAVEFQNVGFVIIDEQHKFGVNQRLELMRKSENAKCLLMTATPIPRTLSMSMYSGIEYFSIKEKPQNRLPIQTTVISSTKAAELISSMKKKFKNDFKMYWVCPLIEAENDSKSNITERAKFLLQHFKNEEIITVHGKMKEDEINNALIKFKEDHNIRILLATTIVEVGIDIPQANIIVIESAENFGLASLHQLRGRVGRNSKQGYCILLFGNELSENAKSRLQAMKESNDGFYISEIDRKLRGSGNILGEAQSGSMKFKFFDEDLHQNNILQLENIFLSLSNEEKDQISTIFSINTSLEFSYN